MTAYDAAVEVMNTAACENGVGHSTEDCWRHREIVVAALNALLAAKQTQTCETCEGVGEVAANFGLSSSGSPDIVPCPDCSSGVVVGTEPLIEALANEHLDEEPRMNHEADIVRVRLDAIMRMLTDSGDMTPMAVRQIGLVLDDEGISGE